jgi:ADP-heptose:LPS heptosyltransferase
MKLSRKKWIDYYLGGFLLALLRPLVWLLGRCLHRDHTLRVRGTVCIIKLLGGGSLTIAYPALLGLRLAHPNVRLRLVTTPAVHPFAEVLGVFDEIDLIDDASLLRMVSTTLKALVRSFRADTVLDFEVYSRLSTVFTALTCARNRLGFYLEQVFWRRNLHTHLVFFNRYAGSYHFYDGIMRSLGVEVATIGQVRSALAARLSGRSFNLPASEKRKIAIGHGCSELGRERMLSANQWAEVLGRSIHPGEELDLLFLGGSGDSQLAAAIGSALQTCFPRVRIQNRCGQCALDESLATLATCHEFWGIDSALLHFARLLGLRCHSFWGPTDPQTRLRPIPGLQEQVEYVRLPCSPCVHVSEEPPCRGNNQCIAAAVAPGGQDRHTDGIWVI